MENIAPTIFIGLARWYGDDGILVTQPAAFVRLPAGKDGKPVEGLLEVKQLPFDEPDTNDLHLAFIAKWEQYAQENGLLFENIGEQISEENLP